MTRLVHRWLLPLALGLGLAAVLFAPLLAHAQQGSLGNPTQIVSAPAPYTESAIVLSAGAWTSVWSGSSSAKRVVLGDAAGLGCVWSVVAAPAAGEGVPFSLSGAPGSWTFDGPNPTNAIYAKCAVNGTLTVVAS